VAEWESSRTAGECLLRGKARSEISLLDWARETGNLVTPDAHLLQKQFSSCSLCRHPHCKRALWYKFVWQSTESAFQWRDNSHREMRQAGCDTFAVSLRAEPTDDVSLVT